jgi:beta-lactamase class D
MMRFAFVLSASLVLFGCTTNNIDIDNSFEKYFTENNATGTFALFNNSTGRFTIYNLDRYKDSAYLPASTFKIVNSLIGLQTGAIVNDSMVIKWDSIKRFNPEWNQDLSMYRAFRLSAVNYYQEVARRIGKQNMQFWLDTLHYGTTKINGPVDSFWLNNTLKITPDEQLGLVKSLYFNKLPFHKLNQETVKKAMLFEDKPEYKLYYKTGWGFDEKKNNIGWIVGWIEENEHPYFFVLNLQSPDENFNMKDARMKILKGILTQMGFFKGKK